MKGFFWGGGELKVSRNDVSFKGYQAKGDKKKRQGEGGGHKIGILGRSRLWITP